MKRAHRLLIFAAFSWFLVLVTAFVGYYFLLRRSPGVFFENNETRLFYSDAGEGNP
jgi:hypothetical protein